MDLPPQALSQLQDFLNVIKFKPQLMHKPDLKFFKDFIEYFGGSVPPPPASESQSSTPSKAPPATPTPEPSFTRIPTPPPADLDSEESDVELDTTGVIEPDTVEPLSEYVPVDDVVVSEENIDKSNEKRQEAMAAVDKGDYEKAFHFYTEAIEANSYSAPLWVKRGQCSLKRNRPNACIQDCTRAIAINQDCSPAYKYRGRAHRLIGNWEEAAKDLRNACKLDFDEETDEWLREVTPNARKLEEHKRKYERKQTDKESRERKERVRRAREEHAKAAFQEQAKEEKEDSAAYSDIFSIMKDPEISSAFMDPEVAMALQDISTNPANIIKYQNNPKIVAIVEKVKAKSKAFGGGFAGFNPFSAGAPPPPPSGGQPSCPDDVGLD